MRSPQKEREKEAESKKDQTTHGTATCQIPDATGHSSIAVSHGNRSSQWVATNVQGTINSQFAGNNRTRRDPVILDKTDDLCYCKSPGSNPTIRIALLLLLRSDDANGTADPTETRGTKAIRPPERKQAHGRGSRLNHWSRTRINPITRARAWGEITGPGSRD